LHQQTVADPMTNEFTWTQIVNWQSTAILHRIRGERWRQQRLHRKNSQLSISLNKLELPETWAIHGRRISLQQACVGHKRFAVIYLFFLRFFYGSQLARLHSEEFIFSGWEISSDFGKSIPICKCKLHTYPVHLENQTAILLIASRQLPLLVECQICSETLMSHIGFCPAQRERNIAKTARSISRSLSSCNALSEFNTINIKFSSCFVLHFKGESPGFRQ
jgi:hypothetical protein